jgi:hypothetical protein
MKNMLRTNKEQVKNRLRTGKEQVKLLIGFLRTSKGLDWI